MPTVQIDGLHVLNNVNAVGTLKLLDNAADPTAEGEMARNGSDVKVYAGGKVVSISGVTAQNGTSTSAPGVNDDTTAGWAPGSIMADTTNDKAYVCLDATEGAAVWTEITLAGTIPTEATKANMEAEDTGALFVPPDLVKNSPGVSKGWVKWDYSGGTPTIGASYNVSSLTDNGAGNTVVNWATDMSVADYATTMINEGRHSINSGLQTTHASFITYQDDHSTTVDANRSAVIAMGNQ